MKIHVIRIVLLIILSSIKIYSQSPPIKVDFFYDERKIDTLNNMEITFVSRNDSVRAVKENGGFIIPKELVNSRVNTVVILNNYKIIFDSLYLTWNPKLPLWNIYIDTKPFDQDKTFWLKSVKRRKKVKIIYMLDNGVGGVISEYRYKI